MSPIQAVAVAVRLFALWFAIFFGRTAPSFSIQIRDFDDPLTGAIGIAVALLALAFVVFLWFFPRTVARALLPAGDPVTANGPATARRPTMPRRKTARTGPGTTREPASVRIITRPPGEQFAAYGVLSADPDLLRVLDGIAA